MAEFAKTIAGLNLNPTKVDFFGQRLSRELVRVGVADFNGYCAHLRRASSDDRQRFVEALTTHTTAFFRELPHFEWLAQEGWASLVSRGAGRTWPMTIWSAAASSGQELYTALISFDESTSSLGKDLRVSGVGTDIALPVLSRARSAVYQSNELSGLSEIRRRRYILRAKDGSDRFRVVPRLRAQARWELMNLTGGAVGGPDAADLIMVRNVLIYFDTDTASRVVRMLVDRLRPGGILMTGHSETLQPPPPGMTSIAAAIYRKGD
jgi:chemotaxis protein methyltransferase CheR